MKKIIVISVCSFFAFLPFFAKTQVSLGVKINIQSQPLWGPTGYDYAEYYYMPEIDVYYDIPGRMYIYEQRGRWVYTRFLPAQLRSYDLYNGYKVVINEPKPFMRHNMYKNKYQGYRQYDKQTNIRSSKDNRYFSIKGHPGHGNQKKGNRKGKH